MHMLPWLLQDRSTNDQVHVREVLLASHQEMPGKLQATIILTLSGSWRASCAGQVLSLQSSLFCAAH